MRFDNPTALVLLLLAMLLLFSRHRRPQTRSPVANLYLWDEALAAAAPSLAWRLRRHMLLILQIACICALGAALARPEIRDGNLRVAIVLDSSMSMGTRHDGASRLDIAGARARALLERLPAGTEVHLVDAGASPRTVARFRVSDDAASGAIGSVRISETTSDMGAAIQYARSAPPGPARIYVWSDAETAMTEEASAPDVEWLPVGRLEDNAAIVNLASRRAGDNEVAILIGVANYGTQPLTTRVALTWDGVEVARVPVEIAPHGFASRTLAVSSAAGTVIARLEHDDALSADNTRQLVLTDAAPIRVVATSRRNSFIETALATHPDVLMSGDERQADVIVCDGCSELPPGTSGVLMIPPRTSTPEATRALTRTADQHAIGRGLELDGITAVPLPSAGALGDSVVIAQIGGTPALVAREAGGRRVVEMRVDPDRGAFPYSAAFPVLVSNIVKWLANRDQLPHVLEAGEPVRWFTGTLPEPPVVIAPDGRTVASVFANGILSYAPTAAGVYRIRTGAVERHLAVNPAVANESDLSKVSAPGASATTVPAGLSRYRDASIVAMLAVLLLLVLEWRYRMRRPGWARCG